MAGKRSATSELNHDNWDQEDEPEEAGTFSKAPEDVLKRRVFKTAKRRITKPFEEGSLNVFNPANLAKFGSKSSQPASQIFGFLSKVQSDVSKTNGTSEKSGNQDKLQVDAMFSFGKKVDNPEIKKSLPMFSAGNKSTDNSEMKDNIPKFSFGNITTGDSKCETSNAAPTFSFGYQGTSKSELKNSPMMNFNNFQSEQTKDIGESVQTRDTEDSYYAKLKGLNQSVSKWINKHVESNPLINLQPIFKDYEKFLEEIESERKKIDSISSTSKSVSKPETGKTEKGNEEKPSTGFSFAPKPIENKIELPPSATTFKFGVTSSSNVTVSTSDSPPKLSFGTNNPNTGFGGFSFGSTPSAPINFGSIPASTPAQTEVNKEEEPSDEPPKVEVKQVEEEGHVYTIRCKLFVKKDGNFVEKGVGSLFLKPVPESDKIQVIVRAHNSLGNVLCNFILSKSMPTQRMGKNNVMIVCIPTPESQPPPVPVLIRVKTSEDADQLLQTLDKYKN